MDADIEKCFDRINHSYLLDKITRRGLDLLNKSRAGLLGRQIESWLKSGVIDQDIFQDTTEGTPQGGVISPLLSNIALDGMELLLKDYAGNLSLKYPQWQTNEKKGQAFLFVRN